MHGLNASFLCCRIWAASIGTPSLREWHSKSCVAADGHKLLLQVVKDTVQVCCISRHRHGTKWRITWRWLQAAREISKKQAIYADDICVLLLTFRPGWAIVP